MLHVAKRFAYIPLARYFAFWAGIYLNRWNPMIVSVIGSTGKTTLLHLIESQLGKNALYSHNANSAFGIPFHILGLESKGNRFMQWFLFFIKAPFAAYRPIRAAQLYVTEADAERPGEGQLLAKLLKPHILVWLSLEEAHGASYDHLTAPSLSPQQQIRAVKEEMAYEFGYFIAATQQTVILNRNNELIARQAARANKAQIVWISDVEVKNATINVQSVSFATSAGPLTIPQLVPTDAGLSALAAIKIAQQLKVKPDLQFKAFTLPPGRSSVFAGARDTTLIDSTYNATIAGMEAMLSLFAKYPATGEKWLVLGDMVEQGKSEVAEHELLAEHIAPIKASRIILVGPRLRTHTKPHLTKNAKTEIISVETPGEAFDYLERELRGGETILFKGARFLEGIVAKLLQNPSDADKLCRRGGSWDKKRARWGV